MGKCVLSFNQIDIVNKKSHGDYVDNDWIVVTWFVADKVVRTDKINLVSTTGGAGLVSGDEVAPFSLEVDCEDTDVVVAAFEVVNLGFFSWSDQVDAIGKIAEGVAKGVATAYLDAVKLYLTGFSGIPEPLDTFLGDEIDEFAPVIVNAVGAAFEDVIIPLVNDVIDEIDVLVGKPNCNGDVLHDVAIFKPGQPVPDLTIVEPTYTSSTMTGCGGAAQTHVILTLHRDVAPPQFATTPAPEVDLVPALSAADFTGTWAEDPLTSVPIINVTISRSTAASGLYAVTIVERVDPRFGIEFDAQGDKLPVQAVRETPFEGNVFGVVRSWINQRFQPSELAVAASAATSVKAGGGKAVGKTAKISTSAKVTSAKVTGAKVTSSKVTTTQTAVASRFVFKLGWQNSQPLGAPTTRPVTFGSGSLATIAEVRPGTTVFGSMYVIQLPAQGVTLCLYESQESGKVVGPVVRYIREQNVLFTRADVALVLWSVVR